MEFVKIVGYYFDPHFVVFNWHSTSYDLWFTIFIWHVTYDVLCDFLNSTMIWAMGGITQKEHQRDQRFCQIGAPASPIREQKWNTRKYTAETATFIRPLAKTRAQAVSQQLRASAVAAYVARWSALLPAAAHRTFAASLLPQDSANQPNLEASPPNSATFWHTTQRHLPIHDFYTISPFLWIFSTCGLLQIWGQGNINTVNNPIRPDSRGKGAWEKTY